MRSNIAVRPKRLAKSALAQAYYSWLCDLINATQPTRSYCLLTRRLHSTPFYWSVPNDDNRAFEGKNLRERFCEENNFIYVPEYFNDECTMLELIVALAIRCESIMADQCGNRPMSNWFWDILSNIGLSKFTDEVYYEIDGEMNVDLALHKIIDRTYHRNGRGGLFPLKHSKRDQRRIELWYQMSSYLIENYYDQEELV